MADADEVDEGRMTTAIEGGLPQLVAGPFETGTINKSSATLTEELPNLYGTLDGIVVGAI